jgi:hypothetical protein
MNFALDDTTVIFRYGANRMTVPSTTQSVIDDMADLVMTAPGERSAILVDLFESIQAGLVVAGLSEEDRYEFWYEVVVLAKNFALFGRKPE